MKNKQLDIKVNQYTGTFKSCNESILGKKGEVIQLEMDGVEIIVRFKKEAYYQVNMIDGKTFPDDVNNSHFSISKM